MNASKLPVTPNRNLLFPLFNLDALNLLPREEQPERSFSIANTSGADFEFAVHDGTNIKEYERAYKHEDDEHDDTAAWRDAQKKTKDREHATGNEHEEIERIAEGRSSG